MKEVNAKSEKRLSRRKRIRARVSGSAKRPRISIFRSNKHIFLQLIDDKNGATIFSASDLKIKNTKKTNKIDIAKEVGAKSAESLKEKKIGTVVFDRGGYKYHGRVKALAEGLREGGLEF